MDSGYNVFGSHFLDEGCENGVQIFQFFSRRRWKRPKDFVVRRRNLCFGTGLFKHFHRWLSIIGKWLGTLG